jgi:hypothetical protein
MHLLTENRFFRCLESNCLENTFGNLLNLGVQDFLCVSELHFSGDEGNAYSDVWRPLRTPRRQALPRPHYFIFFPGRPRLASSLSGSIRAFPDPASPKRDCSCRCWTPIHLPRFEASSTFDNAVSCSFHGCLGSHSQKVAETALVEIGPRLALQV